MVTRGVGGQSKIITVLHRGGGGGWCPNDYSITRGPAKVKRNIANQDWKHHPLKVRKSQHMQFRDKTVYGVFVIDEIPRYHGI